MNSIVLHYLKIIKKIKSFKYYNRQNKLKQQTQLSNTIQNKHSATTSNQTATIKSKTSIIELNKHSITEKNLIRKYAVFRPTQKPGTGPQDESPRKFQRFFRPRIPRLTDSEP